MPVRSGTSSVADMLKDLVRVRSAASPSRPPNAGSWRLTSTAITEARSRGVTWQQIARALAEGGIRDDDGGEIGWSSLKGLYHLERYARSKRPRRRSKKPKVVAQAPPPRASPPAAAYAGGVT